MHKHIFTHSFLYISIANNKSNNSYCEDAVINKFIEEIVKLVNDTKENDLKNIVIDMYKQSEVESNMHDSKVIIDKHTNYRAIPLACVYKRIEQKIYGLFTTLNLTKDSNLFNKYYQAIYNWNPSTLTTTETQQLGTTQSIMLDVITRVYHEQLIVKMLRTIKIENTINEVNRLFTDEDERSDFKKKLFNYEITNIQKIHRWQINLEFGGVIQKKFCEQGEKDKKAAVNEYQNEIKAHSNLFFKHIVNNIKELIESISWKVSGVFGSGGIDVDINGKTQSVPTRVASIYNLCIQNGPDINYIDCFKSIVKIGLHASSSKRINFFNLNKRDDETQKFYDTFDQLYLNYQHGSSKIHHV